MKDLLEDQFGCQCPGSILLRVSLSQGNIEYVVAISPKFQRYAVKSDETRQ